MRTAGVAIAALGTAAALSGARGAEFYEGGCPNFTSETDARSACVGSFRMWGQLDAADPTISFGDELGVASFGPFLCSSCGVGYICDAGVADCPNAFAELSTMECPALKSNASCLELQAACENSGFGWLTHAEGTPTMDGSYSCIGCYGGDLAASNPPTGIYGTTGLLIMYSLVFVFFVGATAMEMKSFRAEGRFKDYYILRVLGYVDKDGQRQAACRLPRCSWILVIQLLGATLGSFAVSFAFKALDNLDESDQPASCYFSGANFIDYGDPAYAPLTEAELFNSSQIFSTVNYFPSSSVYFLNIIVLQPFVLMFQLALSSFATALGHAGLGESVAMAVQVVIPVVIIIAFAVSPVADDTSAGNIILFWFISLCTFLCCSGPMAFCATRALATMSVSQGCLQLPTQQTAQPGVQMQVQIPLPPMAEVVKVEPQAPSGYYYQ